jgi:hypothetical protein
MFKSTFSLQSLVFSLDILVLHCKLVQIGLFLIFSLILNSEEHLSGFIPALRGRDVIIFIYIISMEDEDAILCHHGL